VLIKPLSLIGTEVGADRETCDLPEPLLSSLELLLPFLADGASPIVQPHDGVMERCPRVFVPEDCGFSLVGYAYGQDFDWAY
jgi:hypothetical protein